MVKKDDLVTKIICEEVKKEPALYSDNLTNLQKNEFDQQHFFNQLALKIIHAITEKKMFIYITGDEVRNKWYNIRTKYIRAHKKYLNHEVCSSADLKVLDDASFLEPYIAHRQSKFESAHQKAVKLDYLCESSNNESQSCTFEASGVKEEEPDEDDDQGSYSASELDFDLEYLVDDEAEVIKLLKKSPDIRTQAPGFNKISQTVNSSSKNGNTKKSVGNFCFSFPPLQKFKPSMATIHKNDNNISHKEIKGAEDKQDGSINSLALSYATIINNTYKTLPPNKKNLAMIEILRTFSKFQKK